MSGEAEYRAWIQREVPEPYGRCAEATLAMAAAFPELRRVRGHYFDVAWGERAHWWLVAPNGSVVDPTAEQFPTKGRGHYEPWKEGTREPTGRCLECGELTYEYQTCCSDMCNRAAAASLMADLLGGA